MKRSFLFCLLFLFAILSYAQNGSKNFIDENFIKVTGTSKTEVTPDEIYLKIVIRETDNKGKEALEELEKKMLEKLAEIGVDVEKDVKFQDVLSNFKKYWLKKKDIFTAKSYQMLAHDATTVGKVFQELEAINISNISIERLDHSEIEKFREETKVNAIKAAKKKAETLTEAIDQRIGKAIHIEEIENHGTWNRHQKYTLANVRMEGSVSNEKRFQVDFEKIVLTYKIAVKFKLE